MSFANADGLAQACRWLYLANVVSMYPLVFRSAATSTRALVPGASKLPYRIVAGAVALAVFGVGCRLDDVGRLSSVCGVLAQSFVWLFPAAMTLSLSPPPATAAVWGALLVFGLALIGIGPFIV